MTKDLKTQIEQHLDMLEMSIKDIAMTPSRSGRVNYHNVAEKQIKQIRELLRFAHWEGYFHES